MKRRTLFSYLAVFCLSFIVTVSCTPSNPSGQSATPIRMGYSAWPGWFPWRIAESEQLFSAHQIDVNLTWFDGYLDSINALVSGQLDANTQTLNDTISSVAAGSDQVIVLVNDNSTGNDKIIVREGINTIADLKGKKVAAEEGTVDHFLLLLGLKEAGLSAEDIDFQPLETGAAAAAFVAGQVDAVGVFAPFTTKALERPGSKELFSSKDFPGAIPDHLVVTRRLINERPEAVQALVNTWFDTLEFIKTNPDRSYQIMSERAGVSVEEYKQYEAGTKIFTIEDNLTAFQPGGNMTALPYAAEQISNFLMETGFVQNQPDLSKIFDDRFVKAYAESKTK